MNKKIRFYSHLSIILLLLLIQSLPVVMLKPSDTEVLKGKNVIVYYNSGDKLEPLKFSKFWKQEGFVENSNLKIQIPLKYMYIKVKNHYG